MTNETTTARTPGDRRFDIGGPADPYRTVRIWTKRDGLPYVILRSHAAWYAAQNCEALAEYWNADVLVVELDDRRGTNPNEFWPPEHQNDA